jgi:hypothetical protein
MAWVERLFRTFKSAELELRPIHHRLADRDRAHALLCLLASSVEWHMRRAWAPLLFDDEASPDAPWFRSRPSTALPSRKQGASPSPTPFVLRSASAPSLPYLSNRAKRTRGLRADPNSTAISQILTQLKSRAGRSKTSLAEERLSIEALRVLATAASGEPQLYHVDFALPTMTVYGNIDHHRSLWELRFGQRYRVTSNIIFGKARESASYSPTQ